MRVYAVLANLNRYSFAIFCMRPLHSISPPARFFSIYSHHLNASHVYMCACVWCQYLRALNETVSVVERKLVYPSVCTFVIVIGANTCP